jgi:hypothetical protein
MPKHHAGATGCLAVSIYAITDHQTLVGIDAQALRGTQQACRIWF